jgi:hypothetical protein
VELRKGTTFEGGRGRKIFLLRFPVHARRSCIGTFENGKVLGCGLWYEHRREVELGFYCLRSESVLISTLEGLHCSEILI